MRTDQEWAGQLESPFTPPIGRSRRNISEEGEATVQRPGIASPGLPPHNITPEQALALGALGNPFDAL